MFIATLVLALGLGAQPLYDQEGNPRQFFESGKYQEAVETLQGREAPEDRYLAALCHLRLNQPDAAREQFNRLMEGRSDDQPWGFVGESAARMLDGDLNGALEQAQKAADVGGGTAWAHYQLGRVLLEMGRNAEAAAAFERASGIDPNFAYTHYYAGSAYQKDKRLDRMASHFEYFLKLAPGAPEAPAVQAIMRTVRGR
jgi:tetratricopeptide (TPR) repeat protein